jgi:hypothetical protein
MGIAKRLRRQSQYNEMLNRSANLKESILSMSDEEVKKFARDQAVFLSQSAQWEGIPSDPDRIEKGLLETYKAIRAGVDFNTSKIAKDLEQEATEETERV